MPANQERLTEWVATAAPEPASEIVVGELVALLTTVAVPVRLPDVAGANITLKLVDCPAETAMGSARPLELKPVPVTLI